MSEKITMETEIRIMNLKPIWEEIEKKLKKAKKNKSVLEIDLSRTETIDGAGLQTLMYLNYLSEEFPDNLNISGIEENISNKLKKIGG